MREERTGETGSEDFLKLTNVSKVSSYLQLVEAKTGMHRGILGRRLELQLSLFRVIYRVLGSCVLGFWSGRIH